MTPSVDHVLFACSESVALAIRGVHAVAREFDLSQEQVVVALLAYVQGGDVNAAMRDIPEYGE